MDARWRGHLGGGPRGSDTRRVCQHLVRGAAEDGACGQRWRVGVEEPLAIFLNGLQHGVCNEDVA